MEKVNSVAEYIQSKTQWTSTLVLLRDIIMSSNVLDEEVKWGAPIYTYKGQNIIGMIAFKAYAGIWFHQGVFLKDDLKVLINANEENTKGLRQWRFTNFDEVEKKAEHILRYVLEAVENEKEGLKIKIERNKPLVIPEILSAALTKDSNLSRAFEQFSLSKKREFTNHIASAKREETKKSRLNKIIPNIIAGIGLHDKYRNNK